jgi:hypothetical protein
MPTASPTAKTSIIAGLLGLALSGCFPYQYYVREPALVPGIDMKQSLQVAADEMQRPDIGQGLGLWVLRDQFVTPEQASEISKLYLERIDGMTSEFNIWHASWAIANLYKLGDPAVKTALEPAFAKAITQPQRLTGLSQSAAIAHINSEKITTGFIHFGGVAYAHGHLVVPGNKKYLQSYEEYRQKVAK